MNQIELNAFGENDYPLVQIFRRLAASGSAGITAYDSHGFYDAQLSCGLDRLVCRGLAVKVEGTRDGKWSKSTWRLTDDGLALARRIEAERLTFEALADKMGVTLPKRARRPAAPRRTKDARFFPTPVELKHRLLVEAQSPIANITINDEGEVSSRGLTDWYVERYLNLQRNIHPFR